MSSNGLTYLNNSLDGNVVLYSPSFQLRFGFDFFCMSAILLLLAVEWSVVVVVVGVVRVVVGIEACTINGNGRTAVGSMMKVRMQKYMRRLLL